MLSLTPAHALTNNNVLINFSQLVQAIESGSDVRAIIYFDKCIVQDAANRTQLEQRLAGATTRVNFSQYFHAQEEVNEDLIDTVSTSMKMVIQYSSGELVTLSAHLSVFEDNTATLHLDAYDPRLHTHQLVSNWLCNISNGDDSNGLMLLNCF